MTEPNEIHGKILKAVEEESPVTSLDLANKVSIPHGQIIGQINSLRSLGDIIETESKTITSWELTNEGDTIANSDSYEASVFYHIKKQGSIGLKEVQNIIPMAKIGMSKAVANGWITIDKSSQTVKPAVESIKDEVKEDLNLIKQNIEDQVSDKKKIDYKKRKLIKEIVTTIYIVSKGNSFTTTFSKAETDLTAEMMADESWKTAVFKPYNFDAQGVPPPRGNLHPLMQVRSEFRDIFLEMGFSEMPTNRFVESSFWNFDALFQPQQHPARDAHDTFFLLSPKNCSELPEKYVKRVGSTHSNGGYGSLGYQYEWSIEEAKKNLLRTHTTAISAQMLYNIGKNDAFQPVKFFSIDRVFRNETLDATHLAEFHQVEGVVADYNLTLGDLIGILHEFFKKLGFEQLKFKPAYNPYTEPSMEIFCYHPGLKKWIEVGNSGIFRPEMVLPMNLPEDVNVIAWGLSLERPTMIKYGINNIRDLVGPKVQLQMVSDHPICRLNY